MKHVIQIALLVILALSAVYFVVRDLDRRAVVRELREAREERAEAASARSDAACKMAVRRAEAIRQVYRDQPSLRAAAIRDAIRVGCNREPTALELGK